MSLRRKILLMSLLMLAALTGCAFAFVQTSKEAGGDTLGKGLTMLGAGLAIGLAGLGAGLGMGTASAAAMGALAERPELFGKTLVYIVFIEAIAIYALVVSFMIMMVK